MADRCVLITGFEPFGGERLNPSWEAARRLHGRVILGRRVVARRLPVVFARAWPELRRRRAALRPELTLCLGQAGGRAEVGVERVALNLAHARAADNAGRRPREAPVVRGGPAAYWSSLPVAAVVAALRRRRIPAEASLSAGSFVCNHVFYGLMHDLAQDGGGLGGFLHLPYLPQQAARRSGAPSLALERAVEAVTLAVRTSLRR